MLLEYCYYCILHNKVYRLVTDCRLPRGYHAPPKIYGTMWLVRNNENKYTVIQQTVE